jgi:hypothetical protein
MSWESCAIQGPGLASDLHPHHFLVRLHDLVAHLLKELERELRPLGR